MRFAIRKVAPDEHHRGARCGCKENEAGDVTVDLVSWKVRLEQPADEGPAQKRHRERLHSPVDEERDADAPPVLLDPGQSREIDFHEHGDDHQPDEPGYRQVDLGDLGRPDDMEYGGKELPKRDSGNDAESYPDSEIAFESGHGQTRSFEVSPAVARLRKTASGLSVSGLSE